MAATSGEGIGRRRRRRAQDGDIFVVRQRWRMWAKDEASVAASGEWEASLANERNGLIGRLLNAYFQFNRAPKIEGYFRSHGCGHRK